MLSEHDESAFPVEVGQTCDDLRGMSLLDWFAGQAMVGLITNNHPLAHIPEMSYKAAEAMMNERKRRYDERK
jgi:hypothetical protein